MTSPDYSFRWNNYRHPNLVAAFDFSTLTPGGLMKNMTGDSTYDATINGTLVLANPLIKAKKTKCMDFDGATNYLSLTNPVNGLTDLSIIFWGNMDALTGVEFSRAGGAAWRIYNNGGRLDFPAGGPISPSHFIIGQSIMLACIRYSSGYGYIYYNGIMEAYGVVPACPADVSAYIGQWFDGTEKINGRIDNMLFFNIALTQDKLKSLFRSANPR